MPFSVTKETWLRVESDRVAAIIVRPSFWHRKWDEKTLLVDLKEIGLDYTLDEVKVLVDELRKRGTVADI